MGLKVESSCILSALCFWIGNLLRILVYTGAVGDSKAEFEFDMNKEKALKPNYLRKQWEWRRSLFGHDTAAGIFTSAGWFLLLPPLLFVAYIQSRGGSHRIGINGAIACAAIGAATFDSISTLMTLGANSTMAWISREFELTWGNLLAKVPNLTNETLSHHEIVNKCLEEDGTCFFAPTNHLVRNFADFQHLQGYSAVPGEFGYQSLELTYLITQGNRIWIDAMDWLLLSIAVFCVHRSVSSDTKAPSSFSLHWARFGLAVGILALFDFVAECARFSGYWQPFNRAATGFSVMNTLIFMPIWLIWLSVQLPNAMSESVMKLTAEEDRSGSTPAFPQHDWRNDMQEVEMSSSRT